ncbi:MAG: hypothetical protein V2J25_12085 [Desulfatiglans sp.]|jgi:hypothetical protein|nr:hypothetical protein [Thermodesulfobacteriota bacterium]MEE4353599.1 hypothetical protein [Desulfatiglans sp.]
MALGREELTKMIYGFVCDGILERRKTQYQLYLFFLAASGACAGVFLGLKKPEDRILLLIVPSVLLVPIYLSWWYQRNQIDNLDKERMAIDCLDGWHDSILKYANDLVMIVTPLAFVFLPEHIAGVSSDLRNISILKFTASISSAISFAVLLCFGMKRYVVSRKRKQEGEQIKG